MATITVQLGFRNDPASTLEVALKDLPDCGPGVALDALTRQQGTDRQGVSRFSTLAALVPAMRTVRDDMVVESLVEPRTQAQETTLIAVPQTPGRSVDLRAPET